MIDSWRQLQRRHLLRKSQNQDAQWEGSGLWIHSAEYTATISNDAPKTAARDGKIDAGWLTATGFGPVRTWVLFLSQPFLPHPLWSFGLILFFQPNPRFQTAISTCIYLALFNKSSLHCTINSFPVYWANIYWVLIIIQDSSQRSLGSFSGQRKISKSPGTFRT